VVRMEVTLPPGFLFPVKEQVGIRPGMSINLSREVGEG